MDRCERRIYIFIITHHPPSINVCINTHFNPLSILLSSIRRSVQRSASADDNDDDDDDGGGGGGSRSKDIPLDDDRASHRPGPTYSRIGRS